MRDYYLQYSPVQKAFDIKQMYDIQLNNLRALSRDVGAKTAYLIIAGPGTFDEMHQERIRFEQDCGRPN